MPRSYKAISIRNASLGLATLLLLSACEPYKVVEAGPQTIAGDMTVAKKKPWVQVQQPYAPDGPHEIWTLDGLPLNSLLLYGGLEGGEKLLEPEGEAGANMPVFESSMDGLELNELIDNSVSRTMAKGLAVETLALRPAEFMGAPGFESEFAYTSGGMEMRGYARGANIGGRLYMVLFVAPRLHYYDKDIGEAKAIAESASGAKNVLLKIPSGLISLAQSAFG